MTCGCSRRPLPTPSRLVILNYMVQYHADHFNASFAALADSTRRGVLDQLARGDASISALADRFAAQWLRLQDLEKIIPDYLTFPQYDETLADAMEEETRLLFDSVVREDRSVLDLLTAESDVLRVVQNIHATVGNYSGTESSVTLIEKRINKQPTINEVAAAPSMAEDSSAKKLPGEQAQKKRTVFQPLKSGKVEIKDEKDE